MTLIHCWWALCALAGLWIAGRTLVDLKGRWAVFAVVLFILVPLALLVWASRGMGR